jgi:hypothetical protein
MRVLVFVIVRGLVLAASAQAAPLAPRQQSTLGGSPPVELVSGGCGWGWHRNYWKERWGNLRQGRCVRNW